MSAIKDNFNIKIKLLVIGDQSVGKTCLLERFVSSTFEESTLSTIGIDFRVKYLNIENITIKLHVWDTAGQERFRTITRSYFKGSHGVILVYDVTNRSSYENIDHWLKEIGKNADDNINKILVANKIDNIENRIITIEEGITLAKKYNLEIYETSAKNNINVDESFMDITTSIKKRLVLDGLKSINNNNKRLSIFNMKRERKVYC